MTFEMLSRSLSSESPVIDGNTAIVDVRTLKNDKICLLLIINKTFHLTKLKIHYQIGKTCATTSSLCAFT